MPRKAKLDAFGLRHPRKWPTFTPDQQELIIGFLASMRGEAEKALVAARRLEAVAQADGETAGNAAWWAYSVRTIDWLLSRVPMRQLSLEVKLAQEEGRLCPVDSEPAT
jgi:hypothetical protein